MLRPVWGSKGHAAAHNQRLLTLIREESRTVG
jgi:hypothetical protein